ncbi:Nucleoside diphosphate kinase [Rhynchospora pubera]|uniref:Nucleoside diphosphate kinase n=1 Tax=Rhynchospora pubera TaxID=906938 RepID=A0AAV8GFV9_9POAL|nr:Nucleoside diphosphate kinase [Rhynchospora pubera]
MGFLAPSNRQKTSSKSEKYQGEATMESTFIMIKPDGVQRGLIGEIISRFEKKGFYLKAMKFITVERSFAEKHYADLATKPFFGGLVEYIISGPVVAMVWEGKDVVATGRRIIGATRPWEASPGTIRGDFAVEVGRNVIHGSDAVESAQKEIALWFPEGVSEWKSQMHPWIYEV